MHLAFPGAALSCRLKHAMSQPDACVVLHQRRRDTPKIVSGYSRNCTMLMPLAALFLSLSQAETPAHDFAFRSVGHPLP